MSIKSILYYHIIVNVKAYYAFDKSQSDDINRYQGAKYFWTIVEFTPDITYTDKLAVDCNMLSMIDNQLNFFFKF